MTSPAAFSEILIILKKRYGVGNSPLHVSDVDPFKVLVGAVLSHRTRDEKTDEAYRRLFARFRDGAELAKADVRTITKLIKPAGFYREKAKRIKKIAQIVYGELGGRVPVDRQMLLQLPGVGPKTADIVLSVAFGKPEIAVDTHVEAVAKRLGVVDEKAGYEEVKQALTRLVSTDDALLVNILFVRFGREICRRPRPRCQICPITHYCKYYGEKIRGRVP
ncbi:MAG: endonuclease III [Candidatus Caldarchaeum sp.]|nr:endonuclease III [Candidatus Caldarchaeum sp.]